MENPKKVAVIGGGTAGISFIVMLKEEDINAVCFEKTDKPGGTWCYREESAIGVPSLMPTTITTHSKELGALSNFPPDKEYSNFMRHEEVYEYMMSYCVKHDVLKHIRYNSEVVKLRRSEDYDNTGQWIVTVQCTLTGYMRTEIYDAVVVSVGHMSIPQVPTYEGQEKFKGQIMHSHSLKRVSSFENKRVAVVGMGCSGMDAAVDISNVAKQVYISTRSGAHVFSRLGRRGLPIDYLHIRRCYAMLLDFLPIDIISWGLETFTLNPRFDAGLYAVPPQHRCLSKDPVLNDVLGVKLLSGCIVQKRDITSFTEDGVIFEGDDKQTKVDAVIMATGYKWEFPFLEKDVIENEEGINLYKCVWPPALKHPTLAFVGFVLPAGPGFPLGEMQARYIVQVLSGKIKLPSTENMLKDIKNRRTKNAARFSSKNRLCIRVDFVQYLDELAELIGAKPNFFNMFFTDPKLFFKLMFGPSVSYQYRLQGPHSWDGARDAIMGCDDRVLWPLVRTKAKKEV